MLPRVLILQAIGTNRDRDLAAAFEQAGAAPDILPLTELKPTSRHWQSYQILALPGGFSYADILGAGKLLALKLRHTFSELLHYFVDNDRPVIGICNGFQALVKAGVIPDLNSTSQAPPSASLAVNAQARFECRWVTLTPSSPRCLWTRALTEYIDCPVAHGEGRFTLHQAAYTHLVENHQIALRYTRLGNTQALGQYPFNPNGSVDDIAGICNSKGNVLGLMPHPENHIFWYQHPHHTQAPQGRRLGLALFQQGVQYVSG